MSTAERGDWRRLPETGTILGIRILVAVATLLGRPVSSAVLWPIAAYYALASTRARRASREYLTRVGEKPSFWNVVRHVHTFARVALDRLYFLRGRVEPFVIETHGSEHLAAVDERGTGAILLGCHLGSFEAMRAAGRAEGRRMSIVVDSRSAERVARVLRQLGDAGLDVIPVDSDGISTALRIREAVARGELVGILGDRRAEREERNVVVELLGASAALPRGPFLVAHALRCPVFLVFGLFTRPNRYDLYCEPFADPVQIDRASRDESVRAYAQRYADALAHHARRAPYNWFNFYDFWTE